MSFFDSGDAKLHYQVLGSGEETIVFLHGLVMDNLSSWFFTLANPASRLARVLLYDLRGHGMSERPAADYGIGRHLRDLDGLLDAIGAHRSVVLVGNSFGGLLALNFALRYPMRVKGLVLIDAQLNDQAWKDQMRGSLGLEGADRDRLIEDNFQNWLGRNSRRKSNRLAENAEALVGGTSLLADLQASAVIGDEELRAIRAPVFALYGARSDIFSTAQRLAARVPECRLEVFEGCTHSVLWERTEEVKARILAAIEGFSSVAREALSVRPEPAPELGV